MATTHAWLADHLQLIGFCCCLTWCGLLAGLLGRGAPVSRLLSSAIVALPIGLSGAVFLTLGAAQSTVYARTGGSAIRVTLAGIVLAAVGILAGNVSPRAPRGEKVKRGTRLAVALPRTRWRRSRGSIHLAGQAVPVGDEAKHFKVLGTTGTGKTTAIRELLAGALARGDSAVIADPDGVYLRAFHDPSRGDVILNPFDTRSCRWDVFGEFGSAADADHLSRSMIPDHPGEDRNWRGYARVFLAAVLRQMRHVGLSDPATLHRLLMCAPPEELARLLEATAAAPYLSPENARFFASVRAIANTQLGVLEHLGEPAAGRFLSVRRWVREGAAASGPAVLFLPYRANQIATLRSVLSTWLRLAIFETMDAGESERRIWFVVDELDALGAIDGLKDALARLRKYGGRCVLGIQSVAQVTGCYGAHDAQTIVENCGNTLILRCSSSGNEGTAQYASRLIGDREVMREQISRSQRGFFDKPHRSPTIVLQHVTERAVLATQIEQLPDLTGYLKFASTPEWRVVRLGGGD